MRFSAAVGAASLSAAGARFVRERWRCTLALFSWLSATGPALADADPGTVLTDVLARIDTAQPGSRQAFASIAELQQLLDLSQPVAMALIERLNGAEIPPADRPGSIARSSINYHAVLTALTALSQQDPSGQDLVQRARRAMTEARFSDAEASLREFGKRELAGSETEHAHLVAAKVEALLGRINLMQLDDGKAAADFEAARQQIAAAAAPLQQDTPQTLVTVTVRPAVAVAALPRGMPGGRAPLSAGTVRFLLSRAESMLGIGDLLAARLLYQRAAAAGDGRGATGAGMTYDPRVLSRLDARGMQPDPAAAEAWYKVALALGDTSATEFLALLSRHLARR